MNIHEFYYDQDRQSLYVEFSTKKDTDTYFRRIDISYRDIEYYAPTIITKHDMDEIDANFIIELLGEYFKENDLPEEELL